MGKLVSSGMIVIDINPVLNCHPWAVISESILIFRGSIQTDICSCKFFDCDVIGLSGHILYSRVPWRVVPAIRS